ncbi:hypothetical protein LCGC14_2141420 [marine sediment metagenome]|uniref:Uncharacterized protein n=1 Tax=marine sediment metagenome TaxID=412755 RepID=A0A0F9EKL0_9ZZZZ
MGEKEILKIFREWLVKNTFTDEQFINRYCRNIEIEDSIKEFKKLLNK